MRHAGVGSKTFRKELDALISPRKGRYNSKKYEVDGILFDSEQEGKRYLILKSDERMGLITDLALQVRYPFDEGGRHCFTYVSDFDYTVVATGERVVEDVKGMPTDVYKLKKKLTEARHGITITEWPITKKELARRAAKEQRERSLLEKEERKRLREDAARKRRERSGERPTKGAPR